MYRMGSGSDVLIGTPVAGRFEPELQRVVGMFVNTLALRSTPQNTGGATSITMAVQFLGSAAVPVLVPLYTVSPIAATVAESGIGMTMSVPGGGGASRASCRPISRRIS